MYSSSDVIERLGCTARDIWAKDARRKAALEAKGYYVIEVWEADYKKEKERILRNLDGLLNWECCNDLDNL
jgi:very-short-patch-repair endonuclease